MDLLKEALEKQKREKEELKKIKNVDNGRKWVRKADLEEARIRKYYQEIEKDNAKKRKIHNGDVSEQNSSSDGKIKEKNLKDGLDKDNASRRNIDRNDDDDDDDFEVANIPKPEVIKLLRQYGQPITLFGETDTDRIKRLRRIQMNDDGTKGQRNDFAEIVKKQEEEELRRRYEKHIEDSVNDGPKNELSELKIPFTDDKLPMPEPNQSKQHYVRIILEKLLKDWEMALERRSTEEKKSIQGKHQMGICKQTQAYLKPLFKLLKKNQIEEGILKALYNICVFLSQREYVKANDTYLQLSIGNAPWPMGVTMVGIHERSAREKIGSDNVAHILNDEQQRKYIQSVKRLITYAQKRFPTAPSKMVLN